MRHKHGLPYVAILFGRLSVSRNGCAMNMRIYDDVVCQNDPNSGQYTVLTKDSQAVCGGQGRLAMARRCQCDVMCWAVAAHLFVVEKVRHPPVPPLCQRF